MHTYIYIYTFLISEGSPAYCDVSAVSVYFPPSLLHTIISETGESTSRCACSSAAILVM